MPLIKSTSKQAFGKNIGAELKAGKPMKQAVAIAYAEKNAAQHKGKTMKKATAPKMATAQPAAMHEHKAKAETHKMMMEHHKSKMDQHMAKLRAMKGKK